MPRKLHYPKSHVRTLYNPDNEMDENSENPNPGEFETIWNFPASYLPSSQSQQQSCITDSGNIYPSDGGYKTFMLKHARSFNLVDFPRGGTENGEVSESHPSTPGLASCLIEIMLGL
jgi:hypothetical protein